MTVNEVKEKGWLIFESVSGSRAYGLETPESDTDLKGIYILPREHFYGLSYLPQVSNASHDIVYYELRRFMELAARNNPNILELFFLDDEFILHKDALFDKIKPEMFLSRLCCETFAGYAYSQLKKARGLNKKILNPIDKKKKSLLDFCHVIEEGEAVPLEEWLGKKDIPASRCALNRVPHAPGLYALYHSRDGETGFRGICRHPHSHEVLITPVPRGMKPLALLAVNEQGYSLYCREYQQYWGWVKSRNENRYAATKAHGKRYDAKNMMHTFRLLGIAEEIAVTGSFSTRRPDRETLLKIKAGEYTYAELMRQAEKTMRELTPLFAASPLPRKPDIDKINRLLVEIRKEWYERGEK